jgi:methionyl-tRNA formyltransferase
VLSAGPDGIEIACGEKSLVFTSLQPEGKKAMTPREFLNGRAVVVGTRPFE